jgi:hypothetical protein
MRDLTKQAEKRPSAGEIYRSIKAGQFPEAENA